MLVSKLVYRVRGIGRGDPGDGTIPQSAVTGRVFLVMWPPAQFGDIPAAASFAQRALAAPPRRGIGPLPMTVRLAGLLPPAWACRRQSAHMVADQR